MGSVSGSSLARHSSSATFDPIIKMVKTTDAPSSKEKNTDAEGSTAKTSPKLLNKVSKASSSPFFPPNFKMLTRISNFCNATLTQGPMVSDATPHSSHHA